MSKHTPVLCVNTGEIFMNAVTACRRFGFTETRLSSHLLGRSRTCGGMVFVRLTGSESPEEIEQIKKNLLKNTYNIEV